MKLALEAKQVWRTDPLFKEWYHQDGMYWISDTDLARTVVDHYKQLKADEEYELFKTDEAKKLYDGMFEDGDYNGVSEVLVNKSSGWAEARKTLKKVI